jgi:hypothetical protein
MIPCRLCVHYEDDYGSRCSHPKVMKPDPVHGHLPETCHNARASHGKCGVDATYFKRRRWFRLRLCGEATEVSDDR